MSGWSCPHQVEEGCERVRGRACDPGMKGCILFGRYRFSVPAKNRPAKNPPTRGGTPRPEGRDRLPDDDAQA